MAPQRPMRIPTPHISPSGAPGLVMGPYIVEIDRIVIREPMWAGRPRVGNGAVHIKIDRIVFREVQYQLGEVQYQLEVNRGRNKEIIVKGNFGWVWSMWAGRPRVGNGAMHIKGNFWWVWSMWAGRPRIDRIVTSRIILSVDEDFVEVKTMMSVTTADISRSITKFKPPMLCIDRSKAWAIYMMGAYGIRPIFA
ncbi:hypothetical protein DPMN_081291 [Dreissena polymorpha]|uniref:Uncharacterized protein n=1 Tax=Dreissena polymorpha TaxID=45954 RepID=A0A9D3Y637_DREPO|nr:hypothetical protein DPMN_081291 [Dreissena polymorpha]